MVRLALVVLALAPLGCTKPEAGKTDSVPPGPKASPVTPADARGPTPAAMAPEQRARQILAAQTAALLKTDNGPIIETFDHDAVVLVPAPRPVADPLAGLRDAIARVNPSSGVKAITAENVVTGGNADAVWLSAELAIEHTDDATRVRVTELATADADWKVVAAAFSEGAAPQMRKQPPAPLRGSTPAGPLTPLLSDPTKLAAALAPTSPVFGPDGNAVTGDVATKLVTTALAGVTLSDSSRELRGPSWGFAIGQLIVPIAGKKYPGHLAGLVIAVPVGSSWSVVAAHFATP